MPLHDLTGKKFGKLFVTRFDHTSKQKVNYYECKCDCGNTVVVRGVSLRKGITLSCGCPVENVAKTVISVTIGQKVRFNPYRFTGFASCDYRDKTVRGTVIYVNERNKWFSVEFGKPKLRTSFHFCDIGHGVQVLE